MSALSARAISGPAYGRRFGICGETTTTVPVAVGLSVVRVVYRLHEVTFGGETRQFWLPIEMNMAQAEKEFGSLMKIWECAA